MARRTEEDEALRARANIITEHLLAEIDREIRYSLSLKQLPMYSWVYAWSGMYARIPSLVVVSSTSYIY